MLTKEEISNNLEGLRNATKGYEYTLVAVTKTHPLDVLQNAYDLGLRDFGENKVQEMVPKHETLPPDIRWHFIGHLQRNKVKYIAPFVHLIHSVDSLRLLKEINKQAAKLEKSIDCLLQMHIAKEETKFGLDENELNELISENLEPLKNVKILGLMGMATNTKDEDVVRSEFKYLREIFEYIQSNYEMPNLDLKYLSMGMSQDYKIALEEAGNMLRIGSTIFGPRNYQT
jgi:hypothetical protein